MSDFDLVIRNARAVTASDSFDCDIGIRAGRIAQLGLALPPGKQEIDAAGRTVTPGGVDAHCHLDQPMPPPTRRPTTSTPARAQRPAVAPPR